MKAAQVVVGAVAAIALAGGGFFAGRSLAPAAATAAPAASSPDAGRTIIRGPGGAGGAGVGGTAISGRVISVNPDSITVEVRQPGQGGAPGGAAAASSTIVLVGSTTRVVRTTETDIKLADIKANDQVTIVGQTDAATGTVAANAVVVGGNALQQLFGGQGGAQSPRPSGSPRPSPTR